MPKEGHAASSLLDQVVLLASDQDADLPKVESILRMLIAMGIDVNVKSDTHSGQTALHLAIAVTRQPVPFVRMLIDAGANVNARDDEGMTPLHFTAASMRLATARLLLEAGADASMTNNAGKKPVDLMGWVSEMPENEELSDEERQTGKEGREMVEFLRKAEQEHKDAALLLR